MSNEAMKAELPKGNFEVSSELSEKIDLLYSSVLAESKYKAAMKHVNEIKALDLQNADKLVLGWAIDGMIEELNKFPKDKATVDTEKLVTEITQILKDALVGKHLKFTNPSYSITYLNCSDLSIKVDGRISYAQIDFRGSQFEICYEDNEERWFNVGSKCRMSFSLKCGILEQITVLSDDEYATAKNEFLEKIKTQI